MLQVLLVRQVQRVLPGQLVPLEQRAQLDCPEPQVPLEALGQQVLLVLLAPPGQQAQRELLVLQVLAY